MAEEVAQIAQMPLMHQPGERFSYGLSTNVIGALIEKISGLSLDAYLFKNIFEPLGMKDTYFYLPKNKQDRLVKLYAKNTDTSLALVPPALFNADYPLQKNSKYYYLPFLLLKSVLLLLINKLPVLCDKEDQKHCPHTLFFMRFIKKKLDFCA